MKRINASYMGKPPIHKRKESTWWGCAVGERKKSKEKEWVKKIERIL